VRWQPRRFKRTRLTSTGFSTSATGVIQLPDFQRSWVRVWDEDRIKSLIASVSRAFPVAALMSLDTGGPVNFKPRPVERAPTSARQIAPQSLLLDGQQRMTSLYQVSLRGKGCRNSTMHFGAAHTLDPSFDPEMVLFQSIMRLFRYALVRWRTLRRVKRIARG
jgi:hypothetical protein